MIYDGAYALVLSLHLLSAVFLVGPAALAAMSTPRLVRAGRGGALRDAARMTRALSSATVLVVLLGIALVTLSGGDSGAPEWSMGDPWVSASFALWLVAVAITHAGVVPAQLRAADALETGAQARSAGSRAALLGGLATLCWAAIVVLMVYKPGA